MINLTDIVDEILEKNEPMKLVKDVQISEQLKYHLYRKITLEENIFRIFSEGYFKLVNEVRGLFNDDIIELNDDELMITVNGALVFGVDIDIAIKRKNEPMFAKTQIDKKCLRVKIQKPFYIDKVYFGKYVHTLNFSGLNNYYMVSDKSNCGG
jgi:hypothetical protein